MEIIKRLLAQTPKFFKKLRNIGLALTGIAAALQAASAQFEGSKIYTAIAPYLIEVAVVGFAIATVAQLVTSQPPEEL